MTTALTLDPLLPVAIIAALGVGALVAAVLLGGRGRSLRGAAALALTAALLNPSLSREQRDPLTDIVLMLTDESESMTGDQRPQAVARLQADIRAAVVADESLDLVEARVPAGEDGTAFFDALRASLGDTPRGRLAGVIALTDGQAHDAPETPGADPAWTELGAPIHALVVGDVSRRDRRLVVKRAPAYAIVGDRAQFSFIVEDPGAAPGERAQLTLSLDGGEPLRGAGPIGEEIVINAEIRKRGPNVVEIAVEPGEDELTLVNNRTAISVSGVRDRLRVLLVTGEPHAGARAWRDLLKSDPSVDLVHFTILRPPDRSRNDPAPERELSLIPFPTRELFEEKLEDFDLVIFDQYRRRGVLPPLYLDRVATYVERGGALLMAAGPPFASSASLSLTPLAAVLPARPTRDIIEDGFAPIVSAAGAAHPVTADFVAAGADQEWGRWFRVIDAAAFSGDALLETEDGRPLLVLDRVQQGRVALLLSDQAWLWQRGVDGGGPYGELFRRLAHWLMKEPELEEERLRADIAGGVIRLERRAMRPLDGPAEVTTPSGAVLSVPLSEAGPGRYVGEIAVNETGLHRVRSGEETTVAAAGPLNPREFADLRATTAIVADVASLTGGAARYVGTGEAARLPGVRRTTPRGAHSGGALGPEGIGRGWIGLQRNDAYAVSDVTRTPLTPALLALGVALALLAGVWFREGRSKA